VAVYLLVWAAFGVAVYYAVKDVSMPWAAGVTAGLALVFVGIYALLPLKRIGQARCIAMCRRREPLESRALRAALTEGMTYGLSCVACSAGVMVALVIVGMSNLALMVAGSALILLYKLAGRWPRRLDSALSVALVVAGALASRSLLRL
jgi:predicted metal-binding membrane protein